MLLNLCSEKLVKLTAEDGKRILTKPCVYEKEPNAVEIIEKFSKQETTLIICGI